MKKKQNNSHHVVTLPEVPSAVNMDILSYASDSEIESRSRLLDAERQRVLSMGYDPYAWEVELAYVQREVGIRETRRSAHENYVKNNPEAAELSFTSFDSDEFTVN